MQLLVGVSYNGAVHHMITFERARNLPPSMIGTGHDKWDEWVVMVRVIRRVHEDEDHILKMFFDVEWEARYYKEELEKLVKLVEHQTREDVLRKLSKVVGL